MDKCNEKNNITNGIKLLLAESFFSDFAHILFEKSYDNGLIKENCQVNEDSCGELSKKLLELDLIESLKLLFSSVKQFASAKDKEFSMKESKNILDIIGWILLNNIIDPGSSDFYEIKEVDGIRIYEFEKEFPTSLIAELLNSKILGHLPNFVFNENLADVEGKHQINICELEVGPKCDKEGSNYIYDVLKQIYKKIENVDCSPKEDIDYLISYINKTVKIRNSHGDNWFLAINSKEDYTSAISTPVFLIDEPETQKDLREKLYNLYLFKINRSKHSSSSIFNLKNGDSMDVVIHVKEILNYRPFEG